MSGNGYDDGMGRIVERHLGRALAKKHGVNVIPLGDIQGTLGRGPRSLDQHGGIVLPDFDVSWPGYIGFIDSKAKSKAMYFEKWARFEHGIDKWAFNSYLAIQQRYQRPVALCVVEMSTKLILAATLHDLLSLGQQRPGFFDKEKTKPNVNWDRKAFLQVGSFFVFGDDLANMRVEWRWNRLQHLVRQLQLPFEEAINA